MNHDDSNRRRGLLSGLGDATNQRIFRAMGVVVILAVSASLPFANWRVSVGLLFGGLLSLLNHYWLTTSSSAAFRVLAHGEKPRLNLVQYVLRYALIGGVVLLVYKLKVASLPALAAGLCSFVPALFVEAFREFFLAMFHREEIT